MGLACGREMVRVGRLGVCVCVCVWVQGGTFVRSGNGMQMVVVLWIVNVDRRCDVCDLFYLWIVDEKYRRRRDKKYLGKDVPS